MLRSEYSYLDTVTYIYARNVVCLLSNAGLLNLMVVGCVLWFVFVPEEGGGRESQREPVSVRDVRQFPDNFATEMVRIL